MNDFAWFKLVIRLVGVLLLGLAIPQLMTSLSPLRNVWIQLTESVTMKGQSDVWVFASLAYAAAPLMQTAIGVYLLLGAPRLRAWCIQSVIGRCACCDYDVREITAPFCPECGSPLPVTPERHKAAQSKLSEQSAARTTP